jgi:sigma-B regulation protein RsbU (phosphoserine phosphatase)
MPGPALRQLVLAGGIVIVFLLLLVCLLDTAGGIGQPFGGFTFNSGFGVNDNPAPGAPDLGGPRAGDRILRITGQPPSTLHEVFATAARENRPVQYDVLRRGPGGLLSTIPVTGGTTTFHLSHWAQIYGAGLLLISVWWALGTFIFVVGRDRMIHQLFLTLALTLSLTLIGDILGGIGTYTVNTLAPEIFSPLYSLMLPVCGAAIWRLAIYFPMPKQRLMGPQRARWWPYGVGLLLGSLNAVAAYGRTHATVQDVLNGVPGWWTIIGSASLFYTVIAVLVLLGGLIYDAVRTQDATVRRQVRIVIIGLVIGVLPQVLGELLPLALRQKPLISSNMGYVFLTLAPMALAYAIMRYRMFDVSQVVQRGVVYLLVSSGLMGLYFLLVTALQALLRELTGGSSELVAIVSSVGVAVLLAPVIARSQQLAERLLFRERFLLRAALHDFGTQIAAFYELDPLADALVDEIRRLLRVDAAALYLCREEQGETRRLDRLRVRGALAAATRPTLRVPNRWVLATVAQPAASDLDLPGLRGADTEMWHDLHTAGVALVLPLVTGGDLVGLLLLGRKHHQTGYLREEIEVLEALAGQAALALRNAQLLRDRAEQVRLRSELDIARNIQRRLLPAHLPDIAGLEIAAECLPAQETSGDSYDFVIDDEGTLHLVVSDACGKNLSAAMLIALSRNTLRGALTRTRNPATALTETNEILAPDLTRGQFLAISCASISPGPVHTMRLANAGQMYPALARPGRNGTAAHCDLIETPLPRLPLGLLPDVQYGTQTVELRSGDLLVCYSDGLVDVSKEDGSHFGFDRLADLLTAAAQNGDSAESTLALLLATAATWGDLDAPQDDITVVVVRVL